MKNTYQQDQFRRKLKYLSGGIKGRKDMARKQKPARIKSEFLVKASRELRTQLTVIQSNLKSALGCKNEKTKILRTMKREVNRMLKMIDDFSSLAGKDSGKLALHLRIGNLSLNTKTYEVKRDGKIIYLPGKQFALLQYLLARKNKIVSKDELIVHLWGNRPVKSNSLEVVVRRLRRNINRNCKEKLIKTIYGVGYKISSI